MNLCDDVVGVNKKNKLDDRDMGNQGIADLLEDYVPLTKVCVCVSVWVSVCVCVFNRERERERESEQERERDSVWDKLNYIGRNNGNALRQNKDKGFRAESHNYIYLW